MYYARLMNCLTVTKSYMHAINLAYCSFYDQLHVLLCYNIYETTFVFIAGLAFIIHIYMNIVSLDILTVKEATMRVFFRLKQSTGN